MAITLPKTKLPALTQDPKNLIIFGLPKCGNTTVLSTLENNLIIDTENGSDYVEALKVKATNLKELQEICKAVKEAGNPYKFITIDTVTAIEDMAKPLAIKYYRDSPMFSEKYAQVTEPQSLPNGCGWAFWRQAIEKLIDMVAQCTPNLIICGHVKDTKLDENTSGSVKDLDLAGKK